MHVDRWIFPLALCFICVSSNDDQHYENTCGDLCQTQRLMAPLGSSLLLPCSFTKIWPNWVSWTHTPKQDIVRLSSEGRIKFLNPKGGRVKAFPNQGSKGNYSICIDELQKSDLGCYRCVQKGFCLQVELSARPETLSSDLWLLIYICVGVAAFIVLCICSYLVFYNKNRANVNNPASVANVEVIHNVGVTVSPSAPPQTIQPPVQELRPAAYNSDLVYENDDQGSTSHWSSNAAGAMASDQSSQDPNGLYPNLNQFYFERSASERNKFKFHRELMNRLRQASLKRHYYVNQSELKKQQATAVQANTHHKDAGKNKAKEKLEYKNPIYNRDADQLN